MDTDTIYAERVTGANLVAGEERTSGQTWQAVSPESGQELPGAFHEASQQEVLDAVSAADRAFRETWGMDAATIPALLRACADELEADTDPIVALVVAETALSAERGGKELVRTVEQLRFFATEAEHGAFLEPTITQRDPNAPGGARVDSRRMLLPLGPVGVFGASNFPLAYSVAGGDTAAALAAGCPVIFKAHPAHPALSEVVARALIRGVARVGLPAGWFSLVQGRGNDVGGCLVTAPELTAVGFTGSLKGGRALHDLAASRPVPIPMYAEMGSLNPVFLTPRSLAARAEQIAQAFVGSITTDAGQFCVKPGLVFVPDNDDAGRFVDAVSQGVAASDPGLLVSDRIHSQLSEQVRGLEAIDGVEVVSRSEHYREGEFSFPATVIRCDLETYRRNPELSEEHFGPVAIIVSCAEDDNLKEVAASFEGTLTATVHGEGAEDTLATELFRLSEQRAGRMVWNGMPTGLAVAHATNHGGPYPASTNVLHTSVGSTSVRRFLRPVSYQETPEEQLPPALRDENPLGLLRNVDGEWTREPVSSS